MANPRSILVFRIGLLGDTLVALPAIDAIRRRFPGHALVLLTSRPARPEWVSTWDVLRDTGWFDEVVFYDPSLRSATNLVRLARMALALRERRFEHVFALAPRRSPWQAWRDALFFRDILAVPGCTAAPAATLSHRDEAQAGGAVVKEGLRLLQLVDPLAREDAVDRFRLAIPEADDRLARAALALHGVSAGERLVAFAPGARIAAKLWPRRDFHDVGAQLLARHRDIRLVTIGGPDDARLCEELCAAWGKRAFNLAGYLGVYGSAAALKRCVLYVGNDSGPMHLAAMVGTPCVAIFSAREVRGRWDPFGTHHIVLRKQTECAGCMLEECDVEARRCLTAVRVEEVVRAAVLSFGATGAREDRRERVA